MTRRVTFRVLGIAQPKGSARAFRRGDRVIVTSDNPRIVDWQHAIAAVAQTIGEPWFEGPVGLGIVFRLPRPKSKPRRRVVHHVTRPDLDKCVRCVADALIGILYADDSAIVEVHARKEYAPHGSAPEAEITVAQAITPVELADPPALFGLFESQGSEV